MKAARAVIGLALCALGLAWMLASAEAASPTRNAVVTGYVRVCGGPAPGGCRIETFGDCQAGKGCVTTDRVAAINSSGRRVAVQRLHHARFHMRLTPGRYIIELLGGGKRIHRRVMQRETVTARAHRTVVVRFFFAVP